MKKKKKRVDESLKRLFRSKASQQALRSKKVRVNIALVIY